MSRAPLDRYDTPAFAVAELLKHVPELRGGRLFDPCSGGGEMAAALASRFGHVFTNDVDPTTPAQTHFDLRRRGLWEMARPDWTVTNPPFCLLGEVLRLALDYSKGVALLLRLSAVEVCEGREYLAVYPPARQIVLPRIRFRGNGTDSVTCCWFLWPPVGQQLSGSPIVCIGKPIRTRKTKKPRRLRLDDAVGVGLEVTP